MAELGHGSHAIVYRAHDRHLDREVAIKVLRPELVNSEVSERFRREIRLTSRLEHPHIAHVYGTGEWMGTPYFVTALARGPSLAVRLAREKQLSVDEALSIARDVAGALAHANRAGIIHRDVKPANILLTPDGALLADFGVARAIELSPGTLATSTGTAVGTLLYMSPEQLCADKDIDARSDQYALALVLYEMLAGVPAHVAASAEGLRGLRIMGQHVPVRTHRPSVPERVDAAVERALSPTPADRYGTVAEFAAALEPGEIASGSHRASGTRRTLAQPAAASSGRRWLVAAALAMSMAGVFVITRVRASSADAAKAQAASDRSAPVFSLVAIGDTTRSSPVARALADELSAWPEVQAGVAGPGASKDARHVDVRVAAVNAGLQATAIVRVGSGNRSVQVRFPSPSNIDADSLRVFAGRVLMAQVVAPDSAESLSTVSERSTLAVAQFGAGWRSLLAGNLEAAESSLADAARTDALPQALLWNAIVASWRQPRSPAIWRDAANQAVIKSAKLSSRDSLIAAGLWHRASDRFPEGCDAFASATRIGGGSFVAWYGLAACLTLDEIVVPDDRSPTGARFRTSYWQAAQAYGEAIARLPSVHLASLFEDVTAVTFALSGTRRLGVLSRSGGEAYAGLPSLSGDSVTAFPLPVRVLSTGSAQNVPASYQQAIRRGRSRLLELTTALVKKAPRSLAALRAHASALEYAGVLAGAADSGSAVQVLSTALRLSRSQRDSITIGTAAIRVRLRLSDFTGARDIASALLRPSSMATFDEASLLAPIALLSGRASLAESLLVKASMPSGSNAGAVPVTVASAVARYTIDAVRGECTQLDGLRAAAVRALGTHVSANELPAASEDLFRTGDWARLACNGAPLPQDAVDTDPIVNALLLLRQGERRRASAAVRSMIAGRGGAASGSVSWDTRFLELWLLVQSGDVATARAELQTVFLDLSGTMDHVLYDPARTAGFLRTLALCDSTMDAPQFVSVRDKCRAAQSALFATK